MHKSKVSLSQALSEYSHEYGWLNPESAAFDKETLELCIFCFDYFYYQLQALFTEQRIASSVSCS